MKNDQYRQSKSCAKCQATTGLTACLGGHICNECLQLSRKGRDETTQAIKAEARKKPPTSLESDNGSYTVAGLESEVVKRDADIQRNELVTYLGIDCSAMAIQGEIDMKAENSLEKMLAHQLAVTHKASMDMMSKAYFQEDLLIQTRQMNMAARMMELFQKGLLTMQRVKTGGNQHIVVQHVSVSEGGNAVIGNLQGGKLSK